MDEIFGYMPPVANPPSKKLLLTLLKQARAYGVGLVLATQNPVDVDYRGLSNAGTWMIGRLQTERDKARVMEGLEGVRSEGGFDRQAMERTLAGLGKRRFLLHNVHEDEAVVFNTRWVMSYLAGPLTRDQIKALAAEDKAQEPAPQAEPVATRSEAPAASEAPILPPSVDQYFVPGDAGEVTYFPRLIAATDVAFTNARYKVDDSREQVYAVEFDDGPVAIDWDNGEVMTTAAGDLGTDPAAQSAFADVPGNATKAANYTKWEKALKRWIRQNESVTLYRSAKYRLVSEPGETEGEFRVRLQTAASEKRDQAIAKLRKRYAGKANTLENRLIRAEQAIQREQQQSTKKKLDTAISFGTAILGALLGRKRLSATTASKIGTAVRSAGGVSKEAGDVRRAKQTAEKVRADLAELNQQLEDEISALDTAYDAQAEELREIAVRPKATDIHIGFIGIGWFPYRNKGDGRLEAAWPDA